MKSTILIVIIIHTRGTLLLIFDQDFNNMKNGYNYIRILDLGYYVPNVRKFSVNSSFSHILIAFLKFVCE